ncbi:phosphate-starvation-inducible protein PsiE [Bacillus massiliigorillae]|uniref:phosphate-starvation-inducible protein PsiE n=1 Tax=Bacillus massiliigorillae TaxID=1243664 RepID=UPI0003A7B2D1|nr:phosphate-starvation-inducible protein PsiE [Bacillus massiliigorillae]
MIQQLKDRKSKLKVANILQYTLNVALVLLAFSLCVLLCKELFLFIRYAFFDEGIENQYVLFERILVFFLYFEFIAMIIKYFQENYHFPLRYFLYIGITALIRLVIVEHDNAMSTLLHTLAILVLIISYFIFNGATLRKQKNISKI